MQKGVHAHAEFGLKTDGKRTPKSNRRLSESNTLDNCPSGKALLADAALKMAQAASAPQNRAGHGAEGQGMPASTPQGQKRRPNGVAANAGSGGDTFAADDIGGVKFPRTKIALGGWHEWRRRSIRQPCQPKSRTERTRQAIKAQARLHTTDASLVVALSPNSQLPGPAPRPQTRPVPATAPRWLQWRTRPVGWCEDGRPRADLVGVQQTSVASTFETTIVTAGGATVFNDYFPTHHYDLRLCRRADHHDQGCIGWHHAHGAELPERGGCSGRPAGYHLAHRFRAAAANAN